MTILPNGINTNGLPIAAVDWARGKVTVAFQDGRVEQFKSFEDAAKYCKGLTQDYKGFIWVTESTADSYELQFRQRDLAIMEAYSIRTYCFNPKYTSRYRILHGISKSDQHDAEVILKIFLETRMTCGRLKPLIEKGKDTLRVVIEEQLVEDRYLHDGDVSLKIANKYLPRWEDVPEKYLEFLYVGTKAKKPKVRKLKPSIGKLLMVALGVREENLGWRTFRRLMGNYGQGYHSMARSELYNHLIRNITYARMKDLGIPRKKIKSHIDPKTGEERNISVPSPQEDAVRKQVMKEMAKVLRYLWDLTDEFQGVQHTSSDDVVVGSDLLTP